MNKKDYTLDIKNTSFLISISDDIYTVSENYKKEFSIDDIVKKHEEVYKVTDFRFVPVQGGCAFAFEYIVEQISGIRDCPIGWTSLNGFVKLNK